MPTTKHALRRMRILVFALIALGAAAGGVFLAARLYRDPARVGEVSLDVNPMMRVSIDDGAQPERVFIYQSGIRNAEGLSAIAYQLDWRNEIDATEMSVVGRLETLYPTAQAETVRAILAAGYPAHAVEVLAERMGRATLSKAEALIGMQLAIWTALYDITIQDIAEVPDGSIALMDYLAAQDRRTASAWPLQCTSRAISATDAQQAIGPITITDDIGEPVLLRLQSRPSGASLCRDASTDGSGAKLERKGGQLIVTDEPVYIQLPQAAQGRAHLLASQPEISIVSEDIALYAPSGSGRMVAWVENGAVQPQLLIPIGWGDTSAPVVASGDAQQERLAQGIDGGTGADKADAGEGDGGIEGDANGNDAHDGGSDDARLANASTGTPDAKEASDVPGSSTNAGDRAANDDGGDHATGNNAENGSSTASDAPRSALLGNNTVRDLRASTGSHSGASPAPNDIPDARVLPADPPDTLDDLDIAGLPAPGYLRLRTYGSSLLMPTGQTLLFRPSWDDPTGQTTLPAGVAYTWTVDDASIAFLTTRGDDCVVEAKAAGECFVTLSLTERPDIMHRIRIIVAEPSPPPTAESPIESKRTSRARSAAAAEADTPEETSEEPDSVD